MSGKYVLDDIMCNERPLYKQIENSQGTRPKSEQERVSKFIFFYFLNKFENLFRNSKRTIFLQWTIKETFALEHFLVTEHIFVQVLQVIFIFKIHQLSLRLLGIVNVFNFPLKIRLQWQSFLRKNINLLIAADNMASNELCIEDIGRHWATSGNIPQGKLAPVITCEEPVGRIDMGEKKFFEILIF